jgi:hypothetical protein
MFSEYFGYYVIIGLRHLTCWVGLFLFSDYPRYSGDSVRTSMFREARCRLNALERIKVVIDVR